MTTALTKFLAAILLFMSVATPLWAQADLTNEIAATSAAPAKIEPSPATSAVPTINPLPAPAPHSAPVAPRPHDRASHIKESENLAVLFFFSFIVVIFAIAAYFRHRHNKMANETLRAMIDKGVPITPELVDSLKSKRSLKLNYGVGGRSHKDLRNGIFLMAIGLGIVALAGRVGWIVFFIGAAFAVLWVLGKQNNNDQLPPQ